MQSLLLFLADVSNPQKDAIASTLAWICQKKSWLFEVYYDAYHAGTHYGGDEAEGGGELYGSTIVGGRHIEHFLCLNSEFDLFFALAGSSALESVIPVSKKRQIITKKTDVFDFYDDVFSFFDLEWPSTAVVIGKSSLKLSPYCCPEIFFRNALGIEDTSACDTQAGMQKVGIKNVFTLYVDKERLEYLRKCGHQVEVIDSLTPGETYAAATSRIAKRWAFKAEGFLLGGPEVASYFLPWCCRHSRLAIYGSPHTSVIQMMRNEILKGDDVVYGRQFQDEDFLVLSKLNKCFQLVDPCRPVFPVIECAHKSLKNGEYPKRLYTEVSDEILEEYAADNRVLASILFWSGDLRSIETLYGILDLVALTKIKAGLIISSQWYQYLMYPYLRLLYTPLEQGGVYPNLEPLLGSSVLGVSFEAYLSNEVLYNNLKLGRKLASSYVDESLIPKGWFPIMDATLVKKRVPSFSFNRIGYSKIFPFLVWRKRPFDNYRPGKLNRVLFEKVKESGFEYAFTKTGFGLPSTPYFDDNFVVLTLTAGSWEGWSPFIAVNSLQDLVSAECRLISRKKPGWLIGVVDACCWTFTKHIWERGKELEKMCNFLSSGGYSGELLNTIPYTISRYAKVLARLS